MLQLPPKARIHNVFHVVFLKKHHGAAPTDIVPLPTSVNGRVLPAPERIIRARLNRGTWEVLVQWTGRAAADSTWEVLDDFKEAHPAFQLKDELFLQEGGNAVDAFVGRQYSRRNKKPAPTADES